VVYSVTHYQHIHIDKVLVRNKTIKKVQNKQTNKPTFQCGTFAAAAAWFCQCYTVWF